MEQNRPAVADNPDTSGASDRRDLDGTPLTPSGTYSCCGGYGEHFETCGAEQRRIDARRAFEDMLRRALLRDVERAAETPDLLTACEREESTS